MRIWLGLFLSLALGISAYAAPPLEAFTRSPAIEQVALSPSGDRFALIGRDGDKRKLIVRLADGTPEFVADVGNARLEGFDWVGEDHLIVITRSAVGGGI